MFGMNHDTAYSEGFTMDTYRLTSISKPKKIHVIIRNPEDIQHHVFSNYSKDIIGQVRFFFHLDPAISEAVRKRVAAEWMYKSGVIQEMKDYVWSFSLGNGCYFAVVEYSIILNVTNMKARMQQEGYLWRQLETKLR